MCKARLLIVRSMLGGVILLAAALVLLVGYVLQCVRVERFRETGISFIEPYPYLGNLATVLTAREHFSLTMKNIYDSFPMDRFVAIFELFKPTIVVKDPELIKRITVKDFEHFHDIPFQIDENVDPLFSRMLLALKGQKWKCMRSNLSPAFTSCKMKNMFVFIRDCANKFVDHYTDKCSATGVFKVDVKDLATRYTNDVIASTAFSLEIDSLKERNNMFYTYAELLSTPTLSMLVKLFGYRAFPKFMGMLRIRLFPYSPVEYLKTLVLDTIRLREKKFVLRLDLVNLLLEAKKGTLKHDEPNEKHCEFASTEEFMKEPSADKKWSDDDLCAQAIMFILAGYSTTSTALSFLFYELALNQDVQKKLQMEIDDVFAECHANVTYDAILKMKYMDMVMSEALRKWPPIPTINRLCVESYNMGIANATSTNDFTLEKGDYIWIPIHSIHMDPSYWENPEKFDPERFSNEKKATIRPHTYMPFGSGPRNCIGSRFSLMQMKIFAFNILSKFEFEPNVKTDIPLILSPKTPFMDSKNGFWLDMKSRGTTEAEE